MRSSALLILIGFSTALLLASCSNDSDEEITEPRSTPGPDEIIIDVAAVVTSDVSPEVIEKVYALTAVQPPKEAANKITVDYPLTGSLFPPEFVPPTFLWHDDVEQADRWLVSIRFADREDNALDVLVRGGPPPKGEIDMDAISDTNAIYEGTPYQQSAEAWTPSPELWKEIKLRSAEQDATITFRGFNANSPDKALSTGQVVIRTSKDPVGAPFFYRDVPLMPDVGEHGKIRPLGEKAIPIIAWRLRDVSMPDTKLVLKGMHACGNCHSFSQDGGTLGMDMDGPSGDKGMYALKEVEENMVIGDEDVITWNSFPDKPEGHRTLGLFSRVSPDGDYVASTVNEDIFITNFKDYKILQVFFPTRGIIGIYSKLEKKFFPLPGADDTNYVHTSPVWSPDGQWIYFSRAKAFDAYGPDAKIPLAPNDENEPKIKFDLVRVPFNNGKGGEPELVEGASNNGYSNTFPKISPDGKWLVWTRCRNGLLLRPDGKLMIVPAEGGEARLMNCNTPLMNSWHSFSPNGRWMVFTSKSRTPYTQAFLTHIDEDGTDTPAILVPNCTADNRAVNLPEFINAGYDALDTIEAPVVAHHRYLIDAERSLSKSDYPAAIDSLTRVLDKEPTLVRSLVNMGVALSRIGMKEEALLYTEKAIHVYPNDLHGLFNSSMLYLETKRPYMAEKALNKVIDLAPTYPKLDTAEKLVQSAVRKLESETKMAEQALAKDPDNVQLNLYLAELYRQAGRLEASIEQMEKTYELSGKDPVVACNLAWILATNPDDQIRNGKKAMQLAKLAVEMTGGGRPEPMDVLAAAYAEVGEPDKAQATQERAYELAKKVNPGLTKMMDLRSKLFSAGEPIRMPKDR